MVEVEGRVAAAKSPPALCLGRVGMPAHNPGPGRVSAGEVVKRGPAKGRAFDREHISVRFRVKIVGPDALPRSLARGHSHRDYARRIIVIYLEDGDRTSRREHRLALAVT